MNRRIKVFFDSRPLKTGHSVRGIGSYTKNLLEALAENENIALVENWVEAEVVHYPYFDLFFNTLKLLDKPIVVTIYDVIPLVYPEHYLPGIRGELRFLLQKRKLKNADAVITISETSKKDIARLLDVDHEKIFPIHLAPAKQFKKIAGTTLLRRSVVKYNLPRRFVLYVGDVNYNKNITGLIRAFSLLNLPSFKLVLTGKAFKDDIPETREILGLLKELNLEDKVIITGFVPEEDLVSFYNLATLYCQPSFYEGFGLPVLEAMACGTPVVASRTQSLVEIAEDFALFFDPRDLSLIHI